MILKLNFLKQFKNFVILYLFLILEIHRVITSMIPWLALRYRLCAYSSLLVNRPYSYLKNDRMLSVWGPYIFSQDRILSVRTEITVTFPTNKKKQWERQSAWCTPKNGPFIFFTFGIGHFGICDYNVDYNCCRSLKMTHV